MTGEPLFEHVGGTADASPWSGTGRAVLVDLDVASTDFAEDNIVVLALLVLMLLVLASLEVMLVLLPLLSGLAKLLSSLLETLSFLFF